ncbi:hypothetical protein RQP46_010364 [Phenoliferia psychrophenolica]
MEGVDGDHSRSLRGSRIGLRYRLTPPTLFSPIDDPLHSSTSIYAFLPNLTPILTRASPTPYARRHVARATANGKSLLDRSLSQEKYCSIVRDHLAANKSSTDAGWLSERVKTFNVSHYHYIVDVDCITVVAFLNEAGQHARGERKRKLATEDELMRESILKASTKVLEDVRDDLKDARDALKVATSEVASLTSKVGRRDATLKVYDRALDVRKATEECIRDVEWRKFALIVYELTARAGAAALIPGSTDKKTGKWIKAQGTPRGSQSNFEANLRAALLQLPYWILKASAHAVLAYDELKEERHSSAHSDFNQDHAERYSLQRKHRSPFSLSYVEHQYKIQRSLVTYINRDPLQPWKPQQLALEP